MVKILFMEDENTIREVITEYMKLSGYEVIEAYNGKMAIEKLKENKFDMAILDIMVPGIDGFGVLDYIYKLKNNMSVIMLTALEDEKTQIRAFNSWADDYIIKPVSPIILLKRIESILRRSKSPKPDTKDIKKGLFINKDTYQVFFDGEIIELTLSEFLILQSLYEESSIVFTREQLILRVYNEEYYGSDRIIDAHIKNIRKKLPFNYIRTVTGIGYQFKEGKRE